jgi:uncharacterized membrane protein
MFLFLLVFAGIFLGFVYLIEKKLSLDKFHPATILITLSILNAVIAIPLLFYHPKIPSDLSYWLTTILSILVYGIATIFSYKAFQKIDVSTVGLIGKLSIVITTICGIVFLKEIYTLQAYFGLILILIGAFVVMYEHQKLKLSPEIWFALIMAFGYGITAVLDKIVLQEFSPYTYVFVNNLGISVLFYGLFPKARNEIIPLFKSKLILLITAAIVCVISFIIFLFVLQRNQVSIASPIYEGVGLCTIVIFGIIFFQEKDNLLEKFIGLVAIVTGIIFLK